MFGLPQIGALMDSYEAICILEDLASSVPASRKASTPFARWKVIISIGHMVFQVWKNMNLQRLFTWRGIAELDVPHRLEMEMVLSV